MNQPQAAPAMTLKQINQSLVNAALPPLTQAAAEHIQDLESRDDICAAVMDLGGEYDENARDFLVPLFIQAGLIDANTGEAIPQNDPNTQANQAQGQRQPQGGRETGRQDRGQRNNAPHNNHRQQNNAPAQSAPQGQAANQGSDQGQRREDGWGTGVDSVPVAERYTVHAYSRNKAAICISADSNRATRPTVRLEAADPKGKEFDWANKMFVQVTPGHLPALAAVFLGYRKQVKFTSYGENSDKGFSAEYQGGGKVYLQMFAKGRSHAVPVFPADSFYFGSLMIKRLKDGNPWLGDSDLLRLLQATQCDE